MLLCLAWVRDGWNAEVDERAAGSPVDLRELVVGSGEADFEAFDFAEPAFALGFFDAGDEVVADLGDAGTLARVGPEHRAADAGVLVDARGGERAAAQASGHFAAFEVAEELLPFVLGGSAVFVGGTLRTPPG